jgi:hypothetical protein
MRLKINLKKDFSKEKEIIYPSIIKPIKNLYVKKITLSKVKHKNKTLNNLKKELKKPNNLFKIIQTKPIK